MSAESFVCEAGACDSGAIRRPKTLFDECIAEAVGSAMIIFFGGGVVADWKVGDFDHANDYFAKSLHCNVTWAIGVAMGVLASFDTSGAFLNPALVLNAVVNGNFPARKALPYISAQMIGFFIGSVLLTINFVMLSEGLELRNFYTTGPGKNITFMNAAFNEFLATAILTICVCAITNERPAFSKFHVAGFVGMCILGIGNAFGPLSGYALNPARDFGPRMCYAMFSVILGTGQLSEDFVQGGYFIVPLVAPCLGALAGGLAYKKLIYLD